MGTDVPVVVLGLMGAGKTTLAVALAARWRRPLRDSDSDLLARTGRTAAELALDEGAAGLHRREARHLLEALAGRPAPVVAAAASTVEAGSCRAALESAWVVWLDVPVDVLVSRQKSGGHRPAFQPDLREMLTQMAERRRPLFQQVADLTLRPGPEDLRGDGIPGVQIEQVERQLRRR
jgi:shikimate kinase